MAQWKRNTGKSFSEGKKGVFRQLDLTLHLPFLTQIHHPPSALLLWVCYCLSSVGLGSNNPYSNQSSPPQLSPLSSSVNTQSALPPKHTSAIPRLPTRAVPRLPTRANLSRNYLPTSTPKNEGTEAISMTAVVTRSFQARHHRHDCTRGLISRYNRRGWLSKDDYGVILSATFMSIDKVPKPTSPLVEILELSETRYCVSRFSGWVTEKHVDAKKAELIDNYHYTHFSVICYLDSVES